MNSLNLVAVGEYFINLATVVSAKGDWTEMTVGFVDGSSIEFTGDDAWLLFGELVHNGKDLKAEAREDEKRVAIRSRGVSRCENA